MSFERTLKQLREEMGLTQREVADRIGLTQSRVSVLEGQDLGRITLGALLRYVRALGGQLDVLAIFSDEGWPLGPLTPSVAPQDGGPQRPRRMPHWVTVADGGRAFQRTCFCPARQDHHSAEQAAG